MRSETKKWGDLATQRGHSARGMSARRDSWPTVSTRARGQHRHRRGVLRLAPGEPRRRSHARRDRRCDVAIGVESDRAWRLTISAQGKRAVAAGQRRLVAQYDVVVIADSVDAAGELPRARRRTRCAQRHPRLVVGVCSTFGLDGPERTYSRGRPGRAGGQRRGVVARRARPRAAVAPAGRARASKRRQSRRRLPRRAARARGARHGPRRRRRAGRRAGQLRRGQLPHLHQLRPQVAARGPPRVRVRRRVSVRGPARARTAKSACAGARATNGSACVDAMGRPAWSQEPRYQDLRAMGKQYPEEVDALIMPWLAQHTKAEIEELAIAHQPGRIADPQVLRSAGHAAVHAARILEAGERRRQGRCKAPGLPFKIVETRAPDAQDRATHDARRGAVTHVPHARTAAERRSTSRWRDCACSTWAGCGRRLGSAASSASSARA